jgi:hypothetical protein
MKRSCALAMLVLGFLVLGGTRSAKAADCSGTSCTDCMQNRQGISSCWAVTYSANCSCSISTSNPYACVLGGTCTYTAGGGGGGTGGGGTGGGCFRTAGSWCPADCESCTTIIWY